MIGKVPLLFNSFSKRKPFIDVCFYFYKKYIKNANIYLTIDDEIEINHNVNILTYDNVPKTSKELYKCHSRYYRHYYTLHFLKNEGYKYVINCMDDGWILNVNHTMFDKCIDYIENNNADRLDLTGPQIQYECLYLDDYVSIINPNNNLQWYLTNQCSIWKIDSLLKVYEILGPVEDWEVEKIGSDICRQLGYKFLTFNNFVIDNIGRFQRNVGLTDIGKKLLVEYCENNNESYDKKLKEFGLFI